jgi:Flp pilus assembly protein CpaB
LSKRVRAGLFVVLAILCAAASASIAAGYRDRVDSQLGELRTALVLTAPVEAGRTLGRRWFERRAEPRELPARYLPPDALSDPAEALGRTLRVSVPSGSYLLESYLRPAAPGRRAAPEVPAGRRPLDVTVRGGGALDMAGRGGGRVDVVVAEEPGASGRPRVRVVARRVRLLALAESGAEELDGGDAWTATLALTRRQALALIEAENFAREVRLIPLS